MALTHPSSVTTRHKLSERKLTARSVDGRSLESVAVRAVIEQRFLDRTGRVGSPGVLALHELYEEIARSGTAVISSPTRLAEMIERCSNLIMGADKRVIWIGAVNKSKLLVRLQQIVAVRRNRLSACACLAQVCRGNPALANLTEDEIMATAGAHSAFQTLDRTIARAPAISLKPEQMLEGAELAIYDMLRKTTFPLTAAEIHRRLRRRTIGLAQVETILIESAIIMHVEGGYRSIIEMPSQLALAL